MADRQAHMLSTSDNPWNPWTHFKAWHTWDTHAGYHTLPYLARIVVSSEELSDADQDLALAVAIEEIIRLNITGNYIKVPEPETSEVL